MSNQHNAPLPPMWRDFSFWGMTVTQFLGAFNDNLFKQLILLYCLDLVNEGQNDHQFMAQVLFSVPFVLFSGFAGYLADRNSKRPIIVWCKIAEVVVMLLGLCAFIIGGWAPGSLLGMLMFVLCLMSIQSAFFGPSKYGILPEMLRDDDLPQANGIIQMTTFLAIIFGTALAGYGKEISGGVLWPIGLACTLIALVGTATSYLIRKTPVAKPDLKFRFSALAINKPTRQMLWNDKLLLRVLLISSLFWFVGGVVLPAVNSLGKTTMCLGDGRTSMLAACMGVGIGLGCLIAGKLSKNQVNFKLVRIGATGIFVSLCLVPCFGVQVYPKPVPKTVSLSETEAPIQQVAAIPDISEADLAQETLVKKLIPQSFWEWGARLSLIMTGLFAGFFAVPLQTFMQARPPAEQKGQMIGAMNLINWIGILLAAVFFGKAQSMAKAFEVSELCIFPLVAFMMLPVALFFKPPTEKLRHEAPNLKTAPPAEPASNSENGEEA